MEEGVMNTTKDTGPLLVQWLLTENVFTDDEALTNIRSITKNEGLTLEEMTSFLAEIRELLRPYHLELLRIYSFECEDYLWVLFNTNGDKIAQLATNYSTEQIEYFKQLIRFIADSPRCQGSTVEALANIHSGISKKRCEELIDDFISSYWLIKNSSGKLMIGPRTICELETYLKEEDLFSNCPICHNLVTSKYVKCENGECEAKIHQTCFDRVKTADPNFTCPSCEAVTISHGINQ